MSLAACTINRSPQHFDSLARSGVLEGIYFKDAKKFKMLKEYLESQGERVPYSTSWIGNERCVLSYYEMSHPYSEQDLVDNYLLLCSYAGIPAITEYPVPNPFSTSMSRRFDVVHPDRVLEFKVEKISTATIVDLVANRRYPELIKMYLGDRPLYITSPSGIHEDAKVLLSHLQVHFIDLRDLYKEVWDSVVKLHTNNFSGWFLPDLKTRFPLLNDSPYF